MRRMTRGEWTWSSECGRSRSEGVDAPAVDVGEVDMRTWILENRCGES